MTSRDAAVHGPGEGELPGGAQGPPPHTHERVHDTPPAPEEIGRIASRYDFKVAE